MRSESQISTVQYDRFRGSDRQVGAVRFAVAPYGCCETHMLPQDAPRSAISPMPSTSRAPPELGPVLPRPLPAVLGLPDWFKTMPQKAFSAVLGSEQMTVKKCPPFIDAMTFGFLIPLIADLRVEDGMLSWDRDVPAGGLMNYSRSPIDFRGTSQVSRTPFSEDDR